MQAQSLRTEIVRQRNVEAQTLETTWKSGGVDYKVTTPRNADETIEAWWTRHDAAVAEGLRRHPKD